MSDLERKLERLDDAFLFILGSVGLIISFIQIGLKDIYAIIEAMPFFLLGIVLPFLVGYARGAIGTDSIVERMRGWIYFLVGSISYFAFLISQRVIAEYRQIALLLPIVFSLLVTYRILKWAKQLFNIDAKSNYAFSGTALNAICNAFLAIFIISLYKDLEGKDIILLLFGSSPELFFWISIIIASLSIVLILEKSSRDALQKELVLPSYEGRIAKIRNFFIVKGLFLGAMLFEYALDFDLKARFLWLQAFTFWILASFLWIARIPIFPQIFLLLTIIFAIFAGRIFYKTQITNFRHIEKVFPFKVGYGLTIFASITIMLLVSFLSGVLLIVLSTLYYCSYLFKKPT